MLQALGLSLLRLFMYPKTPVVRQSLSYLQDQSLPPAHLLRVLLLKDIMSKYKCRQMKVMVRIRVLLLGCPSLVFLISSRGNKPRLSERVVPHPLLEAGVLALVTGLPPAHSGLIGLEDCGEVEQLHHHRTMVVLHRHGALTCRCAQTSR